jgi:dolichol-phosphate mannosyltransferase
MPLELWVQAAHHQLRIVEVDVPLIYLDEERSFGGALDDADTRLQYYHRIIDRAVENCQRLAGSESEESGASTSQQGCPCR